MWNYSESHFMALLTCLIMFVCLYLASYVHIEMVITFVSMTNFDLILTRFDL